MQQPQYIQDILAQPDALRIALQHYPAQQMDLLRKRMAANEFSRIVLTGMGSSYNGAYAAFLELLGLPIPTLLLNSAELLHYGLSAVDGKSLLWMNSQSGQSAEIIRIIEALTDRRPAFQLSMTNYVDSPLAQHADLAVPIHAGNEATVSTKTYINMAAYLLLAAWQLRGKDWQQLQQYMFEAADAIEAYLKKWLDEVAQLDHLLQDTMKMIIIGRGASMGAVWNGSLVNKEAAKCTFEGMNAADFRHGPLELVAPDLTVLAFEGASHTAGLNYNLALEIKKLGGKALWIAAQNSEELPTILLPHVTHEEVLPLVEILPMQLLSIVMAKRNGYTPGEFRHVGKITLVE